MEITLGWKRLAVLAVVAFGLVGGAFGVMELYRQGEVLPGCQPGRTITIASEQEEARSPKIWADWIVWYLKVEDENGRGHDNVFAYHIPSGSVRQVTDDPALQTVPEIYGDVMVWKDRPFDGSPTRIKAHTLSNGTTWTLPFDLGSEAPRGMWEDRLLVEANSGLYVYNFTSKALTQVTDYDTGPVEIWGDRVVWTQWNQTTNTSTMFLHDLGTNQTTELLSSSESFRHADIYKDIIVYARGRGHFVGDAGIHMYDLSTGEEERISEPDETTVQQDPRIAGEWIAYKYGAAGKRPEGIYGVHAESSETVRVTDSGSAPDVWQNRVVYMYFDDRTARTNVRLTCLEAPGG